MSATRPAGSVLACDQGEWEDAGTVTFQWLLDGEAVPTGTGEGETGSHNPKRFRCTEDHVGRAVACAVTSTNEHGATTVETNPVTVVAA